MGDPTTFSKTKALDVFVYLGIGISLVVSVTNILTILFTAIDRKYPDILSTTQYLDSANSDVRFAIATLIVMFPLYIGLSWYVARDIAKFLYKRDILIRKVMIYLTIFVTICTLIGTLVSVIYTYLGGELSVRFGFKACSVFIVALSVFGYYFYSARRDYTEKTSIPLIASVVASLVVIVSLVWSVKIIGTPSEMRAKKIDDTRLSDLSMIQQQVLSRFQMTDKLPSSTAELINALQGVSVPTDPLTHLSYEYKIVQQPVFKLNYSTNKKELVTPAIFELCATFGTVRQFDANGRGIGATPASIGTDAFYSAANYYYSGDQSPFWNHGVGETCFKRIISSDMYWPK